MKGSGNYRYIFKKEFKSYFVSPIAYIVISVFLVVSGWFFFSTFFIFNQAELRDFFEMLPLIFSFVVPAITMRLFSEEMNIGSYETLTTMPVTLVDVIVGKFLASLSFIAIMLIPTFSYAISISFLGDLDWGPVIGGYTGALFVGAAFSAIGIFASALTRSQIVAFIIGTAICFFLTVIDRMLILLPESIVGFFQYIGAAYHFKNISRGVIDSRDLIYFMSICFIALFGAHLVLEERR